MEMNNSTKAPILFPFEPDEFWENMRSIIRDEIKKTAKEKIQPIQPNSKMSLMNRLHILD